MVRVILSFYFLAAFFCGVAFAERVGPWDLDRLKTEVPAVKWLVRDKPVHSLTYEGEAFKGAPTEVFAFYASPSTLGRAAEGGKFPGVVLIHGGGGTAFAEWVHLWAKRGYAAIAMDLGGTRPEDPEFDVDGLVKNPGSRSKNRVRLSRGGPDQGHGEKFDSIGGETSDDWPFHAVSSVIRAHTLLRSFSEVEAGSTAVTGISWGGYTTCLAASLDDRFKAAVPVYGCGFLHEGESVQKPSIDKLGERRMDWVREYDPGSHLNRCTVPIFFVNGTNDVHYVLDSYMKSYGMVRGTKQIRIQVNMPHGHPAGWAPQEIGLFIDSHCKKGVPLPVLGKPLERDGKVVVSFRAETGVAKAQLHFTTDEGVRSKRVWRSMDADVQRGQVIAEMPPTAANTWFISVTDERGAMVSSEVFFRP
jgi:dienelactone hydrolase